MQRPNVKLKLLSNKEPIIKKITRIDQARQRPGQAFLPSHRPELSQASSTVACYSLLKATCPTYRSLLTSIAAAIAPTTAAAGPSESVNVNYLL
jgi:hypothetical protein